MKLILGLGNPGAQYRGTRHNIGFAIVDELAERADVAFESAPVDALVARVRPGSNRFAGYDDAVLIAKPLTFMNLSGISAAELTRYYKIAETDVLIVLDEVQLPLGRLRARARGSAGGHNGLKSIIEHMGSDIARLRVGVGRGDDRRELADHVLARFEKAEAGEVERMTGRAADAAEMFITSGIGAVMNAFNGGDPAVTE